MLSANRRAQNVGYAASVIVALACLIPCAGAALAETRIALVIGNGAYATGRLKNPRSDATLMARTLAGAGFDVMTLLDADGDGMKRAIADFGKRLSAPDTVALFYYAGHGVQTGGDNYLIPLGPGIASANDVTRDAVPLGQVFQTMAQSEARLNIVLLDACRNNPFAASNAAAAQGLAPVVAPSGTIIGFATAPGEIARDGDGSNSPYTEALAANIPSAGLTLEEVFRAARRRVRELTANAQTPWEHSSLLSEFFFHPKTAEPESSARRSGDEMPASARLAELDAWEKVRSSTEPEAFRAYIGRFPDGDFAEVAAFRLSKLENGKALQAWSFVVTGATEPEVPAAAAAVIYERAVTLDAQAATVEAQGSALKLYEDAAKAGFPPAMFALARAYDRGRGVAKDLTLAARWYERAAEKGHTGAMSALGTMREFGDGTTANLADALRLYRLAADAGDAAAMTSLGYLYAEGKGVVRNAKEARRLYQQAADKGNVRAMYNFALMELRGAGGPVKLANGAKFLKSAADKGHALALHQLALLYDEGRGVARNPGLAAENLLNAMKAARNENRKLEMTAGSWSFATRREVQRLLVKKGLYNGVVHGFFNRATRQALAAAAAG